MSSPQKTLGRIFSGSTADVPLDQRREHWENVVARVHLKMEISTRAGVEFNASLIAVALDDVNLAQVTSTAHSGRRKGRLRDERGQERCLFIAVQRGQLSLRQEERETLLQAGDMALVDPRLPSEYAVPHNAVFLGVSLPRDALTQRVGALERVAATPLSGQVPIHQFAHAYLDRLFAFAPGLDVPELFRMKNHVLDLIAVTIGRQLGLDESGSAYKLALLHRIKAFIEERLHDPALNIEMVAEKFRVTPRYVSQLFRDDARTFNGFARYRRLERCRHLLELARAGVPSIGEIAAITGFGSQAYLSRAFQKEFGVTPGDYRRSFQRRIGDP